jgi:hypothetical protein
MRLAAHCDHTHTLLQHWHNVHTNSPLLITARAAKIRADLSALAMIWWRGNVLLARFGEGNQLKPQVQYEVQVQGARNTSSMLVFDPITMTETTDNKDHKQLNAWTIVSLEVFPLCEHLHSHIQSQKHV